MSEMLVRSSVYTHRHIGQTCPLRTAAFFCAMLSRETYETVGELDEVFGRGFFEDDDYCRRIEARGLRIVCAEDVFIHHQLSASFDKMKQKDRQQLFEDNKKIYEKKWGEWTPHNYRKSEPLVSPGRKTLGTFLTEKSHLGKRALSYWIHKSRHMAVFRKIVNKVNHIYKRKLPGYIQFTCNICGSSNVALMTNLSRETASCCQCGSTVRMRSIIHVLSLELFGESLVLKEFPLKKDLHGIGMSDWDGYARTLEKKLDYTNTYYHKEPKLDITSILESDVNTMDFIISTDVYEHVLCPVARAFENTRKLLKDSGVFVFTVPYTKEGEATLEHFGELNNFEILNENGKYILKDISDSGDVRVFDDLVFHGGPGSTLEMRIFSEQSLMREFKKSGFTRVKIYKEDYLKYGIYCDVGWSLPIAARQ